MARLIDNLLVIVALLASVGYAAAALGPKSLRVRAAAFAARSLLAAPAFLRLQRLGTRLEAWSASAAVGGSGACGGCESCGTESKAPAAQSPPASEVRVPLASIGRRRI